MKNEQKQQKPTYRTCPKCGAKYYGAPAISRIDNATPICPRCGSKEALTAMGIKPEEIDQILEVMEGTHAKGIN